MDQDQRVQQLLLTHEVERFFYHEADLLDRRAYAAWLDLLHEDIHYWVPMLRNVKFGEHREREETRAGAEMNWMDEGKATLSQRVGQIMTGMHWAEEPFSRTTHMLSNLEVLNVEGGWLNPAQVETRCRFLIYKNRVETETDFFVGKREDMLVRDGQSWRILRRKAILDQSVLMAKNLTFFF